MILFNNKGNLHKSSTFHINKNGTKFWTNSDINKIWFKKGRWHRLDGSAVEWDDGTKWYYIYSIKLCKEEFNSWIKRIQRCI